jgi:hypothetical protein
MAVRAHDFLWGIRGSVRDRRSGTFRRHYERGILDVLAACERSGAPFWFTEGTLIGLLRHGRNDVPELANPTDDDVDVMVETGAHEAWLEVSEGVRRDLLSRGWSDSAPWGSRLSTSRSPGARQDKLKLRLLDPGNPRVWTHVDFHSYLLRPGASFAESHGTPDEYPFEHWAGRMPVTLIHPMRQCACHGRTAPCVRDPIAVLRGWHGAEYARSDLAFPPGKLTPGQRASIEASIRELDARDMASFAPLLVPKDVAQ